MKKIMENVVLNLIQANLVSAAHDVSNGGLIVALCEMAMGSKFGVKINKSKKLRNLAQYFFGEDQGRYVLEIDKKNLISVEKILKNNDIFYENIGITQVDNFEIEGEMKLSINDLYKINNQWYNNY